ncbi:chloride channel protein [Streptococcus plurextorum]|uniref:chloride channel protein n=1 Tax=Streptococcus plurextorum TaxID=456876 RepID=UPI0003FFF1BA|nr:chloride channel protein [Streptococcus plurextorum]
MLGKKEIHLTAIGLVYSSVIAMISYGFIMAEKLGSHFLWESLPHQFHFGSVYAFLVLGILTGLLIFLKSKWGNLPKTSHDLLHELSQKGTVFYQNTWRSLVLALVILISGAGVGPEAPLLGAVIAYSVWQADKLRYFEANWEQINGQGLMMWIQQLCHPSRYLLSYPASQKQLGKSLRNLLIANGLFIFCIMMRLTDQPSFVTKLGETSWSLMDILFFLPLCLYGYAVGKGYAWLKPLIRSGLDRLNLPVSIKMSLGAFVIFGVTMLAPTLLFSGQHSLHAIVALGMETPVLTLVILSFAKLIFLDLCLWTGWTGGDIFPVTFAAFLQGFAVAQVFPQVDSLFVVLVVSLSMAIALLEKEWLAGIFISLFFPMGLAPVSLLIVGTMLLGRKIFLIFQNQQKTGS